MTLASKRLIWAQHLIFWGSLLFINLYVSLVVYDTAPGLARFGVTTVLNVAIYLICYYWFVDRYYETKRYGYFFLASLGVIFVSTVLRAFIERFFYLNMTPDILLRPERKQMVLIMMYFSQGVIVVVSSLLGIAKNKLLSEHRLAEADKVKVETELSLLKAKINPHFLLNTLNNIYFHSREEGSKSSEAIIQLSQLLQFTIYETSRKRIPLEREIEILRGLIELYRLRFKHELNITLAVAGPLDGVEIPPAIALILLENALKHSGIGMDEDSFINLQIAVSPQRITVRVANSTVPAADVATSVYSGLGLASLRGLLQMEYPQRHVLNTYLADDIFHTEMELSL